MRISDWSSDVCSSDLVALVATGLGALGVLAILGVSTSAIAGIAGLASGLASIGAQALAKPHPARRSITQPTVDPNAPQPYVMGGIHLAGDPRPRAGDRGPSHTVHKPYLFATTVSSAGGPVH